jgi:hypothetical protein
MQTGSRPNAYSVIYELLVDLIGGRKISRAYVIGTSVGGRAAQKAHFDAAELRGVVQAACASVCPVDIVNKASVSNHFGERKFDEYVSDDGVWKKYGLQDLPKGRRAAAFAVIAQVLRNS